MNDDLKQIIAKIRRGDGLSDPELDQAIEFFKEMATGLEILGKTFHLAWKECYFLLTMLQGFKDHRIRDKKPAKRTDQ